MMAIATIITNDAQEKPAKAHENAEDVLHDICDDVYDCAYRAAFFSDVISGSWGTELGRDGAWGLQSIFMEQAERLRRVVDKMQAHFESGRAAEQVTQLEKSQII